MRILIPIIAVLLGLAVVLAVMKQSAEAPTPPAPDTPTEQTDPSKVQPQQVNGEADQPAPDAKTDSPPVSTDGGDDGPAEGERSAPADEPKPPPQPSTQTDQSASDDSLGELHVKPVEQLTGATLGSDDPDSRFKLQAELTYYGPGIKRITLRDYDIKAKGDEPYVVQQMANVGQAVVYPFQARSVSINGQEIRLSASPWDFVGKQVDDDGAAAVTYRISIVDAAGGPVLDIRRTFRLAIDSYDLEVEQRFVNRTGQSGQPGRALKVVWDQCTMGDARDDGAGFRGDDRQYMAGYVNPERDASRRFVFTNDTSKQRVKVIEDWQDEGYQAYWPVREDVPVSAELVWLATLNRYFAVVVHQLPVAADQPPPQLDEAFARYGFEVIGEKGDQRGFDFRMAVMTLTSKPFTVDPGQDNSKTLKLGLYAGPRHPDLFKQEPYQTLSLKSTVVYTMGCTICTFQPLAKLLLAFLEALHYVVRDWGVAIVLLVLFVRTLLHPITKKSQINMMKMGKQMQSLAPEVEKIKKKYKDDQKMINQETMKLYRERGVNPVNMLGCLPMFLQMPIWVALYAMLYLAIQLRHQPAFYGVFQAISGDGWGFLRDLSVPDRFISFFDEPRYFNLIMIPFDYSSLNILPILMGVVFFVQQKLTTPPAATEEQKRQQKIMGFTTMLFPVLMYSVPSGLTLYILSSTAIGILESYLVRKHIREQEEAGVLFEGGGRKPPKPGGFRDRMQKMLEQRQRDFEKRRQGENGGGGSGERDRRPFKPK